MPALSCGPTVPKPAPVIGMLTPILRSFCASTAGANTPVAVAAATPLRTVLRSIVASKLFPPAVPFFERNSCLVGRSAPPLPPGCDDLLQALSSPRCLQSSSGPAGFVFEVAHEPGTIIGIQTFWPVNSPQPAGIDAE